MKPLMPAPKPAAKERKPFDVNAWKRKGAAKYQRTKKHRTEGKRFQQAFHSEAFVGFVKSLACSVPGCRKVDIECAHVGEKRSQGGMWYEIAPLCSRHHREQEGRTAEFEAEHGINLIDIAAAVALRWKEKSQ